MYKKGQLLKQAITPGNPRPSRTKYIFDHYTISGKLAVYSADKPKSKVQTFPSTFLEAVIEEGDGAN